MADHIEHVVTEEELDQQIAKHRRMTVRSFRLQVMITPDEYDTLVALSKKWNVSLSQAARLLLFAPRLS